MYLLRFTVQYIVFMQLTHQIVIATHLQFKFDAKDLFYFLKTVGTQEVTGDIN